MSNYINDIGLTLIVPLILLLVSIMVFKYESKISLLTNKTWYIIKRLKLKEVNYFMSIDIVAKDIDSIKVSDKKSNIPKWVINDVCYQVVRYSNHKILLKSDIEQENYKVVADIIYKVYNSL